MAVKHKSVDLREEFKSRLSETKCTGKYFYCGLDSNPGTPDYEAGVPTPLPRSSILQSGFITIQSNMCLNLAR